jgi:hypothetical protein
MKAKAEYQSISVLAMEIFSLSLVDKQKNLDKKYDLFLKNRPKKVLDFF